MTRHYREKDLQKKKAKAYDLRKKGLTLREISTLLGYSHEWVNRACSEIEKKMTILDKKM